MRCRSDTTGCARTGRGLRALASAYSGQTAACAGLDALARSEPLRRTLGSAAQDTAAGLTWEARAGKILRYIEERLEARTSRPG